MKNKTKGLIAGVAGIALLTGGSTFALWSANGTLTGGTIQNGNLAVTAGTALTWVDASETEVKPINIATFRMVPGDTLVGTQPLTVVVQGDNLVADFALTSSATLPEDVTATYRVLDGTTEVVAATAYGTAAAHDFTNAGTKNLTVEVTVDFDAESEVSKTAQVVLNDMAVTLVQRR